MCDMTLSVETICFAAFLAALFGFSIVRGGLCTLAAIEEAVLQRRWRRLQAFAEVWLWVMAIFLVAHVGWHFELRHISYVATLTTCLGGILLALGAFVNQACPFGTIAGIGSGYWSYLATPVGLFVGSVIHFHYLNFLSPLAAETGSPLFAVSPIFIIPLLGFLGWRLVSIARHLSVDGCFASAARGDWSPLSASVVLAFSFAGLAISVDGWSYTHLLSDIAARRYERLGERLVFFVAMFAGSLAGGLTNRGWHPQRATLKGLGGCFLGGILMGIGNRLVPGAHDSLTLIGQPLLLPYAWFAMGTIYLALAALYVLTKARRSSQ